MNGEHTAVVDQRLADAMNLNIGDSFSVYKNDVWNQNAVKDAEAIKIKIIGTQNEGNVVLSEEHLNPNLIIVDSETANLFAAKPRIQVVNIWTEKGYDRQIQAQLQNLPELSDCTFHNADQQLAEYIKSDNSQQTV